MRKTSIFLASLFAFIPFFSVADTTTVIEECPIRIDFTADDADEYWGITNDGVMGGLSKGYQRFQDDRMIFEGTLNTNGGGFTLTRAAIQTGSLRGTDNLVMRVKSDGRGYKVRLQTNAFYRGRAIAFEAFLPDTPAGQWTKITIPLKTLKGSIFGRPVSGAEFDASSARSIGFILADGTDGPFALEIEWIEAC